MSGFRLVFVELSKELDFVVEAEVCRFDEPVAVCMETEDVGGMLAGSTVAILSTSVPGEQILPTETGTAIQVGVPVCVGLGTAERMVDSGDSRSLHLIFEKKLPVCALFPAPIGINVLGTASLLIAARVLIAGGHSPWQCTDDVDDDGPIVERESIMKGVVFSGTSKLLMTMAPSSVIVEDEGVVRTSACSDRFGGTTGT